jgi:hypothetical protein
VTTPVPGLFALHPAAHRVQGAIGERDDAEGVDHLMGLGQDDRVDRRRGGRHVEGAEADPLLPGPGLLVDPARHIDVSAGREYVDDLVVLHIGHRRGVVGVDVLSELDEGGRVETDGARPVQPFAVRRQQGLAIGDHGVVDRVPVTGQLGGHLRDGPAPADLAGRPLGSGRQQTVLGGDAMVLEHPAALGARGVHAVHPVLLPGQRDRGAVDG